MLMMEEDEKKAAAEKKSEASAKDEGSDRKPEAVKEDSIIVVLARDAPLHPVQLQTTGQRATSIEVVQDVTINALFEASADATEEAILHVHGGGYVGAVGSWKGLPSIGFGAITTIDGEVFVKCWCSRDLPPLYQKAFFEEWDIHP
ncbi:hypothetical protein DFJ77DRAFT_510541 [Powellomyces hirtus]|nr:hypothetical protein DFJ77DRAFT_510541 [Powellomyces hirtus]